MAKIRQSRFGTPRIVLLVEVERYCKHVKCMYLNRIGLTKSEARAYKGFTCERCEGWNEDVLSERDISEWWKEIAVNGER